MLLPLLHTASGSGFWLPLESHGPAKQVKTAADFERETVLWPVLGKTNNQTKPPNAPQIPMINRD